MEDKIKNIINEKLNDVNFLNNGDSKEIELINKLCTLFPELNTINKSLGEIVLDEITIDNETYYEDSHGGIWNESAELVGFNNKKSGYTLFNKSNFDIDSDIYKFL